VTLTRNELEVDDDGLAALLTPRDDLAAEVQEAPGVFGLAEGPFDSYRRVVTSEPIEGTNRHRVVETVEWDLAIPIWGALFRPLVKLQVRRKEAPEQRDPDAPEPPAPWWSPPARLDARSAAILSRLCGLSMLAGYLGTIITQTMTYAAKQFHAGSGAQGATLATVRFGVLASMVLLAISDRRGRHGLLRVAAVGGVIAAAAGALSPNLWVLGGTQTVSRAFSTTLALLITVVAAEEMPAGGRAYAASVLAMTAALGAGGAVILLAFADKAIWAWRIVYVFPLLVLPWFLKIVRRLPESRRFVRPHGKATMAGHRGRLALLAASGFFGLMFLAPVTQFQNDFLRKEHAFSALGITIFTIFTNTPGGIGVVVGGRLADVRGRRMIGAIGTIGGALFLTLGYQTGGPLLWAAWIVGTIIAAMCVPALSVYGPELFPTALRGRANGFITLAGVCGSAVGLVIAGHLRDHFHRYGPAFAVLAAGPLVVAVLVITLYPETAHMELEELNPEDATSASAIAAGMPIT
jgi:MFS family permease